MCYDPHVNVDLSPSTETLVRKLMESHGFESEDAAIADAVSARLGDEAYWAELAEMLEAGRESLRSGRGTPWSPDLAERILRESRELRDSRSSFHR